MSGKDWCIKSLGAVAVCNGGGVIQVGKREVQHVASSRRGRTENEKVDSGGSTANKIKVCKHEMYEGHVGYLWALEWLVV